jgi:hypothetical protein
MGLQDKSGKPILKALHSAQQDAPLETKAAKVFTGTLLEMKNEVTRLRAELAGLEKACVSAQNKELGDFKSKFPQTALNAAQRRSVRRLADQSQRIVDLEALILATSGGRSDESSV